MKTLLESLITVSNLRRSKIKATDETINQIVKEEMDKYGHDCDLNHVDVSEVTNMNSVFSCHAADLGKSYLDLNPDISEWDVSNVKDMYYMFWDCKKFNCNIGKWDVRKVKDMTNMFRGCANFNQDLSNWDVSNVVFNLRIFKDCPIQEKYKPHFKI